MKRRNIRLTIALGTVAALVLLAHPPVWAEPLSAGQLDEPEAPAASKQIQEVQDAVGLFQRMQLDEALEKLKDAVAKHPELPPPRVIMAQLFARARQSGGVRFSLERAVVENPKDPEAYVILAEANLRERRVTESALLFEKANGLMAGFRGSEDRKKILQPRILGGLAAVAQAREDWATAERYLRDWLKIDAENTTAMQRLARALFKGGKAKECLDMLKKAKEIDPAVLTPGAQMALLYHESGPDKFENAKQWMDYALKTAPNDLRTRLIAAQWALETNQIDMVKEQTTKAMQLDPQSLEAIILRGVVSLFQKEYNAAERYFESAHLLSPGNFAASNNLALALCEQDDDKKRRALEYAAANARQFPKGRFSAESASTYGWVLYQNKRPTDAEKALRQAASGGNMSADTAYYLARVWADLDRTDKDDKANAIKLLEGALKSTRPFSKREDAEALLKKLQP